MDRVFNFSAGPSMMPLEVLQEAQRDLLNFPGSGCSVMEMSHRSASFEGIINEAEMTFRKVAGVSDDYAVLFLQGGATTQFSTVAMNLAHQGETTNYAVTGNFANLAYKEALRWGNAVVIASSEADKYTYIPEITDDMITKDAKYLHITGNNTIFGTAYKKAPKHANVPLVADWSSAILGQKINVNDYDLIYAGAQKNMGPSGLAVVIIKKELLEREIDKCVPVMLRYKQMAEKGSMYNTPPCWSIYMAGLMFKWVDKMGGVEEMEKRNLVKSKMLYDAIDNSKIFKNSVRVCDRSIMNVTFTLPTEDDTKAFLDMAKGRGMINLKGHRVVGGVRASLYNGMPLEGVEKLVKTIHDFEKGERV